MKPHWTTVRLGEMIEIFDHRRVPLNSRQREQRKGSFPYYGAQGIIDSIDDYLFDGDYLLVAEDGENLNSRKLPLALRASGKFWVNNHAHIIRGVSERVDDLFLLAALNNTDIKPYVTGAAQPKLSQANLRLIEIPLPALRIQRRIAGILSAYDDLVENCERRIRLLDEMARSLYREWFVLFRYPGNERLPLAETSFGRMPRDWDVVDLQAVVLGSDGIQTGPFGSQLHQADYSHHGIPVVMPKDLRDFRIDEFDIARIPEETAERLARHRMEEGDIVYGRRGDIGRRAFVMAHQRGYLCGTGSLRIRPDSRAIDGWYLFQHLGREDVVALIAGRAQGVTMPNLNSKVLASIPVVVPPRALQDRFRDLSFPFALARENLIFQRENLRQTRDLLLPRLLSGQLSVEDIK